MAAKKASKNKRMKAKSQRRSKKAAPRRRAKAAKVAKKVQAIPVGMPSVVAGFAVAHCQQAVDFLKAVFGAKVMDLMKMPDGTIAHCDLKIGDSRLMCGETMGPGTTQTLRAMFYVKDSDATFAKALAAGASVKEPLKDQFYGDRSGRVIDPCGNEYIISTHIEDVSRAEMERRMQAMMAQMGNGSAPQPSNVPTPPPPPPQAYSA